MFRYMLLLVSAVLPLWAGTPEEEGLRIARLVDEANNGFVGEKAEMEMLLINAHGDEVQRKMTAQTAEREGDGDRSITTFQWPADVKGTRMLTWSHATGDDDQWLYLPALKRVKRISSRNKSGAFMGSEFSYEDLGSREVEEYTYKYLGEDEHEGRKCWKMEQYPVSTKSGYSKEITWVDQGYMNPVKVEYYDRKGELLKVGYFRKMTQYGKYWRADEIFMENVQTKKKSSVIWTVRELGAQFDDYHFASDALVD